MNAGKMNKLIKIMRPSNAVDDYGAPAPVLTEIAEVWAERLNKSAKEIQSGSDIQINNSVWRMWPTDITHNDEIHYDSIVYRVTGVINDTDKYIEVLTVAAL